MTFKEFKNSKIIRFLNNRYVIIFLLFLIWMLFFDENSYLTHHDLNKEIDKLEKTNQFYQSEIEKDQELLKSLDNRDSLIKYAREQYKMKRKDEDIYLIEYDTIEE